MRVNLGNRPDMRECGSLTEFIKKHRVWFEGFEKELRELGKPESTSDYSQGKQDLIKEILGE